MNRNKLQANHTWAICTCCHGHGQVDNPAFSNGFTSSEWAEQTNDEREAYLGGVYDVPCRECGASGKVQVLDVASLTFAQKRVHAAARREARLQSMYAAESAAEHAAERRMGC